MDSAVGKRQIFEDDYHDDYWWHSSDANAVKWSIVGAIFLVAFLWFIGGYYHAQRRIRRGVPPLLYHRWLVTRSQRERFQPRNDIFLYQQPQVYNEGYHPYNYPPPVYNPTYMPPPEYQPPPGGSKANPSQQWPAAPPRHLPTGEYSGDGHQHSTLPAAGSLNAAPQIGSDGYRDLPPRPVKPSLLSRLNIFK